MNPTVIAPDRPRVARVALGDTPRIVIAEQPTLILVDADDEALDELRSEPIRAVAVSLAGAVTPHRTTRAALIAWALSCPVAAAREPVGRGGIPPRKGVVAGVPIDPALLVLRLATDPAPRSPDDVLHFGAVALSIGGQGLAVRADGWQLLLAGLKETDPSVLVFRPEAAGDADIAHDMVRTAMLTHSLPWRIERDWTWEVLDAKGNVVVKCMYANRAEAVVALAEKLRADNEEASS